MYAFNRLTNNGSGRCRMHTRSRFILLQQAFGFIIASLLVVASLFLAAPASAGTTMDYSVIGFSTDGRYVALEVSGMVDGLGEVVCSVDIYDLEQNQMLPASPRDTKGGGISCETALKAARSDLRTYNINSTISGENIGIPLAGTGGSPDASPTWVEFTHKGKTCVLSLHENSDKGENPWGITMVRWNIGLSCNGEAERLLLARDSTNFSVKIEEARIMKDRIVLFTRTSHPDFEGPGSSPGVVAASLSQAYPEGVKLDMEVLGFSDDEKYFGYWLSGADVRAKKSRAEFHLVSTNGGEEVLKESETGSSDTDPREILAKLKKRLKAKLAELKLGNDPGAEMYKSGTATKTTFNIAGSGKHQLRLKINEMTGRTELVLRIPDKTEFGLLDSSTGFRYSLNTVRLSKSGESLAVVLKYSLIEGGMEDRAYAVSFAPIKK